MAMVMPRIRLMNGRIPLCTVALIALAGCAAPTPIIKYRTVRVAVPTYIPMPADLTKPCPKAEPTNPTWGEVLRVASARGACVDKLNGRLKAIRSVQPAPASSS